MKKITLLFVLFATFGLWQMQAQTFAGGAIGAIPDNDPLGTTATAAVSGLPTSASSITDISVNLSINHTWAGDLIFELQAPTGEAITLFFEPGSTGGVGAGDSSDFISSSPIDFSDAYLDNAETMGNTIAGNLFICQDDARCTYFPASDDGTQQTFANLISTMVTNGSDPNGNWSLNVADTAGGDTGDVPAWSITFTTSGGGGMPNVLVAGSNCLSGGLGLSDIQSKLMATGSFASVDIMDADIAVPSLATLNMYDAILVYTDCSTADPTTFGNNVALYIEGGGGVVDAVFMGNVPIGGNYLTNYALYTGSTQTSGTATLGTVNNPAHPIMAGVSSFNGGTSSYRNNGGTIQLGASTVAEWSDGLPLVLAATGVGPASVNRAFLNFFAPSMDARSDLWVPSTDGAILMRNALLWVANVSPGGSVTECGNAPEDIPNGAPGVSSGLMNPSVANVADSGLLGTDYAIENVTVNLEHTWAADIEMVLVSPSGTRLALSTDNGDDDGLDVAADLVFMDSSANEIGTWDGGPPAADYRAEGGGNTYPVAFGDGPGADMNVVFDGEDINGNWTLEINDDAGGDVGVMNSFCITFIELLGDPPVISCPMDITESNDPGVCGAVVNFADAVALDPEDGPIPTTQTMGPASGSVFPVGDTIIEFSATDSDGNTSTCQFTVTVEDNEDPVVTCSDIIAELDANGMVTVLPGDVATSSDNCPGEFLEFLIPGVPGPASSLTTLFASNNGGGNGGAVYFDVTVAGSDIVINSFDMNIEDAGAFTVDVYVLTGSTFLGNETNAAAWGAPVAQGSGTSALNDNPSLATLDNPIVLSAGTTNGIALVLDGTHSHRYTNGTGGNQNYSNADIAIFGGSASNLPFTATIFNPRVFNGAVNYQVFTSVPVPSLDFDCADVGDNPVTVQATDAAGNTSTCTAIVTVEDNIAPVIACIGEPTTATTTVSDSPGAAIPDNTIPGVSVTIDVTDDVTITDLDVNLNVSHTWVGDLDMVLTSPAGTSVVIFDRPGVPATTFGCSGDNIDATLDDEAATPVEDECGAGTPTISGSFIPNNPLSAFDGESTLGTWTLTVTDNAAGDTGTINSWGLSYSYDVSSAPYVVALDANGMATINASDLLAGVDEACGYTVTTGGGAPIPGTLSTIFGSDNGGSPGGAVYFDLTVAAQDISITDLDINTPDGGAFTLSFYTTPGSYVGNEGNAGAWTLMATGNGTGAGIDTPSNAVLDAAVPLSAGTSYGIALVLDSGHGHSYTNGTGGNQNYSNADLELQAGAASNVPFDGSPFSPRVVNTNINYIIGEPISTTIDLDCSNLGLNEFEITVTDDSGNTATCTATVEVIDVTDPILVCMDATVELDENGEAVVLPEYFIDEANSFDACGITITAVDVTDVTCDDIGTPITVTVFASDADGNLASCTATLTVVDLLPPVIENCPADMTVDPGPLNLFYELPDYWTTAGVTATDNCTDPVTIISQDPVAGTLLPDGTYTISLCAEDEYGNEACCTFELTIESTLGVGDTNLDSGVAIYPNPATNVMNIDNRTSIQLEKAAIYDIHGRLVQNIDLSHMTTVQPVDVSKLSTGVYLVQIQGEGAQTVKRLIKE
ncbi:MAG: proprotein convertase P-domain-containing protein [Alteromonas sp.]|nr:proprotein convertase P-domain-containing protein [Alteromonas sp.]